MPRGTSPDPAWAGMTAPRVPALGRLMLRPMRPRDPGEPTRGGSSLELFFDLVFVIAVASAATSLHHLVADGRAASAVGAFLMVFFAIWWAWMNFVWFATAFDTDDWLYRVLTVLQMGGVLVLAAGVPASMEDQDYTTVVLGYVIMRLAMVAQWLRAAHGSPELRTIAFRYAAGIAAVQVLWIARLLLPHDSAWGLASFVVAAGLEIAVPIWAERSKNTPWHAEHISDRYGSFTLIVLGEGLVSAAAGIAEALRSGEHAVALWTLVACALVIVASLWWMYFWAPWSSLLGGFRQSLTFGYVHYVVFASAAAVPAGVEVAVVWFESEADLPSWQVASAVTLPVAVFVIATWSLLVRHSADRIVNAVVPAAGVVVAVSAFVPSVDPIVPIAVSAVVMAAVVGVLVARPPRGVAEISAR